MVRTAAWEMETVATQKKGQTLTRQAQARGGATIYELHTCVDLVQDQGVARGLVLGDGPHAQEAVAPGPVRVAAGGGAVQLAAALLFFWLGHKTEGWTQSIDVRESACLRTHASTHAPWRRARRVRSWRRGRAPPPPLAPPPNPARLARSGLWPRPAAVRRQSGWIDWPWPGVQEYGESDGKDGRTDGRTDHEVVAGGAEEVEAAAAAGNVLPVVQALQRHQWPLPQDDL